MVNGSPLHGLIFDLDGTLANTGLDFAKMCRQVGLPEGTPLLEFCAQCKDQAQVEFIFSVIHQHEMLGAEQAEWIEGAEKMLIELQRAMIPMAIVTRNMKRAAQLTVTRLGIPIDFIITREDCQPKPDPQGLLLVAEQWQLQPENLAYVGDYKYDLQAARNAGMAAILKLNGHNHQFSELADKAIREFQQLTDIMLGFETS